MTATAQTMAASAHGVSHAPNVEGAALRGAVKAADDDLGEWLKGLVTGQGDSPSQVIVSGILSVVPGLGQAMDVRDIVVGVIAISACPTSPAAWLDISITLIGCVPVAGDGLKTGFRLLKGGEALPRILDGLSPKVRGNVEKWFREIDWGQITRSVKGGFDDVMGAFIDGLDSWVVKTVMGRKEVALLIEQMKDLRMRASRMLDEAIEELKRLWNKAMGDAKPKSTAGQGAPHSTEVHPSGAQGPSAKVEAPAEKQTDALKRDRSGTEANTPDKPRTDERRATKKKQGWPTGVPAEHIADYWTAKNKRNLKKANNTGRLWEEWDKAGRQGIDHVWVQIGNSARPGVIGETKSTLFGAFRFLAALPKDIQDQLQALGKGEVDNPTPQSGQPNIFHSEGRDTVDPSKTRVDGAKGAEDELKKGLGDTKTKGVQMSHKWIADSIDDEQLTPMGRSLATAVRKYWKGRFAGAKPPYARWIIMVTGRQKHLHEAKQGHQHEIQKPLITLPDNILEK